MSMAPITAPKFERQDREVHISTNISRRGMSTVVLYLCWLACSRYYVNAQADDSSFVCDYAGLFAFGDSMVDTGNAVTVYPGDFSGLELPYGETYFGKPAGRASDGRLVIDFIAQAMRFPFLSPYLKSIGANYSNGVNFAASGATAVPVDFVPFHLGLQFDWFRRFKAAVSTSEITIVENLAGDDLEEHETILPDRAIFENSLYYISIGGNDYIDAFLANISPAQAKAKVVPAVVNSIKHVLEGLYSEGARNFMVANVPAIGCSLKLLAILLDEPLTQPQEFDILGCSKPHNDVAALHNNLLKKVVDKFYTRHSNVTVVYADYYAVNYDVLSKPENYGLTNTFQACCGVGPSPYNVNLKVRCTQPPKLMNGEFEITSVCDEPDTYVNWDGAHFTEAMYEVVARAFLSGEYLRPANGTSILGKCNFDISAF